MKNLIFLFLMASIALNACTSASPTPDANQLATAAVQTFQVQLTQSAPRDTPTPQPSQTAVPPTEDLAKVTLPPQITKTSLPPADKAEWVAQSPTDNSEVGIGQKFNMTWVVRNTGPTTWNKYYALRYFAGAALGSRSAYYLKENVLPDSQIKLTVDMVAPNYPGTFNSVWVLTNDKDENFYTVYLTIIVVKGPTKTPTKRPTRTPTPTPTS